jgi:hypothetical protein
LVAVAAGADFGFLTGAGLVAGRRAATTKSTIAQPERAAWLWTKPMLKLSIVRVLRALNNS